MCAFKGVSRLDLVTGKSPKWHTCEACRELKGHDSWRTTGQKVQSGLEVISRLKLAIRSSREAKLPECLVWMKIDFSHSISYPIINTLIPMKCIMQKREPIERKTLRKVSTTHPPYQRESYSFLEKNLCSLFPFPLPLLYPLRGDLYPNTTHPHSKC